MSLQLRLTTQPANRRRPERRSFNPWVGRIPWRRKWQPTPVLLPGEFHGQRSLAGCSPWVAELDTTEAAEPKLQQTNRHIWEQRATGKETWKLKLKQLRKLFGWGFKKEKEKNKNKLFLEEGCGGSSRQPLSFGLWHPSFLLADLAYVFPGVSSSAAIPWGQCHSRRVGCSEF